MGMQGLGIDWPERVVAMQRNWIGRSEGVEFAMRVAGTDESFRVFTTRPDTVFHSSLIHFLDNEGM